MGPQLESSQYLELSFHCFSSSSREDLRYDLSCKTSLNLPGENPPTTLSVVCGWRSFIKAGGEVPADSGYDYEQRVRLPASGPDPTKR